MHPAKPPKWPNAWWSCSKPELPGTKTTRWLAHNDEPYFRLCFAHADGSQDEFTVTVEHTQHLEPK
jgi:hypothetical protein